MLIDADITQIVVIVNTEKSFDTKYCCIGKKNVQDSWDPSTMLPLPPYHDLISSNLNSLVYNIEIIAFSFLSSWELVKHHWVPERWSNQCHLNKRTISINIRVLMEFILFYFIFSYYFYVPASSVFIELWKNTVNYLWWVKADAEHADVKVVLWGFS